MSRNQTDEGARLAELEATVRGLTQELVEANERIRILEDAVDVDGEGVAGPGDATRSGPDQNGEAARTSADGGSTRQMGDDGQADEKADADLDDIIVA